MSIALRSAFAPLFTALALGCAPAHAAPDTTVRPQGVYVGDVGNGNTVLMSLQASGAASVSGAYHYARGWTQDNMELAGEVGANQRIALRETLMGSGQRKQSGRFEGRVSGGGATISGTWTSADGRRSLPFTLTRAAAWTRLAALADGGVRDCERPRFFDARYARLNRELAEACDYFLADGHQGPGTLRLEIDSLGQYMVAAVAYASNGGHELPPEVIAVDLGSSEDDLPESHASKVAARR